MRFHWFAQQYYSKLPPEYGERVRSSWVTAPTSYALPEQVHADYAMYIRLMQHADKAGWDSVLLNEHHQTSFAMTPSPNLIAAALAVTTKNVAIALCGNSLALYNPPIAGGRGNGDVGLPIRWPPHRRHGQRNPDGYRLLLWCGPA